jgi:5-methylcytosine-specific restriction endonuclease McrA
MTIYSSYINSSDWKNRAAKIKVGKTCLVCGSKENLQVHHLNYKNLGHEKSGDIVVLCALHHRKAHFSNNGNFINDNSVNYTRVKKMWRHYTKMKQLKAFRQSIKRSGSNQREDLIN